MKIKIRTAIYWFEDYDKKRLYKWLKKNNYTLRTLAQELGCSPSYLSDMVNGRRAFKFEYLNWLMDRGWEIK